MGYKYLLLVARYVTNLLVCRLILGGRGLTTIIVIIIVPISTRGEGGGSNRGGRRKRLDIGGDRMDRTRPMSGREEFYDNIEC